MNMEMNAPFAVDETIEMPKPTLEQRTEAIAKLDDLIAVFSKMGDETGANDLMKMKANLETGLN